MKKINFVIIILFGIFFYSCNELKDLQYLNGYWEINSVLIEGNKVKNYPWHEMPDNGGWSYGTNLDYMKEISKHWLEKYDWRKTEKKINSFKNYKTKIDDIDIHFIHQKGSGANPKPLLLSHGWPGSILEFLDIIDKLTHPEKFGGKKEDSFDVVVP